MFSILTYRGQGSWAGRIVGILFALALSAPVVAMWYYGDSVVMMMVDLGMRQNATPKAQPPARRVFEKSTIPGVVNVQILNENHPPAAPH